MQYFVDTSALIKYYHPEIGSQKVEAICAEAGRIILISGLGMVEAQSAFAMKARSGAVTPAQAATLRTRFLLDVAAGEFKIWGFKPDHLAHAQLLVGRHGSTKRLRTLDALQLAVALELFEAELMDVFVVSDKALLRVAQDEGVPVLDPEVF